MWIYGITMTLSIFIHNWAVKIIQHIQVREGLNKLLYFQSQSKWYIIAAKNLSCLYHVQNPCTSGFQLQGMLVFADSESGEMKPIAFLMRMGWMIWAKLSIRSRYSSKYSSLNKKNGLEVSP